MRHACLPAGRSARQRPPPSPHRRPRQGAPVKQKRTKQQSVAARVWKSSYYRRRQRTMPNARTRRGSGTRAPYPPDAHRRRVTTMAGHAGAQTETWGGASCAYKHTNMRLRKAAGRRWPPAPRQHPSPRRQPLPHRQENRPRFAASERATTRLRPRALNSVKGRERAAQDEPRRTPPPPTLGNQHSRRPHVGSRKNRPALARHHPLGDEYVTRAGDGSPVVATRHRRHRTRRRSPAAGRAGVHGAAPNPAVANLESAPLLTPHWWATSGAGSGSRQRGGSLRASSAVPPFPLPHLHAGSDRGGQKRAASYNKTR